LTEARRKARPWLKRMGLDRQRNKLATQLSGGERQRVASARALVNAPRLLLADEPTGSLDTQRSREVLELLREVARQQGTAVLLATHDPQAARVADRAVTLRDGRLIHSAPADVVAQAVPAPSGDG